MGTNNFLFSHQVDISGDESVRIELVECYVKNRYGNSTQQPLDTSRNTG